MIQKKNHFLKYEIFQIFEILTYFNILLKFITINLEILSKKSWKIHINDNSYNASV